MPGVGVSASSVGCKKGAAAMLLTSQQVCSRPQGAVSVALGPSSNLLESSKISRRKRWGPCYEALPLFLSSKPASPLLMADVDALLQKPL